MAFGLSISPVIEDVIATILGLGAGIVGGIHAVKSSEADPGHNNPPSVSVLPVALLVTGIAIGAPLGISLALMLTLAACVSRTNPESRLIHPHAARLFPRFTIHT